MNCVDDRASLAVVVVTYGSHHLLEDNLGGMAVEEAAGGVVIVDNFQSIRERAAIRGYAEQRGWTFIAMDGNVGFGAAVNHGADWAFRNGFLFVLVLNPDARADTAVVRSLLNDCRSHPLALVAPTIVRSDGSTWFSAGAMDRSNGDVTGTARHHGTGADAWISGACFIVSKQLWELVGGFDPTYFLYWEDIDISWRTIVAGGALRVRQDLIAEHDPGGTQRGTGKSALYYYYNCRNRLLFAGRNLPLSTALGWALKTPGASKRILYRGGRRQLTRSVTPLFSALAGSVVGVGMAARLLAQRKVKPSMSRCSTIANTANASREPRVARVYASLRTAHLERFQQMLPAEVLYNRARYDFDEALLPETLRPRRLSRLGMVKHLITHQYDIVEINEPLMSGRWPDLLAQILAIRVRSILRRNRTSVVAYCIGYTDPTDDIVARRSIPRVVAEKWTSAIATTLAAMTDRLAFGTAGSLQLYGTYLPSKLLAEKARLFEALPSPCLCLKQGSFDDHRSTSFVFVGAFDQRKGIPATLRLWERLSDDHPDWTLRVLGKGSLTDAVLAWARSRREVVVELDPSRARIHEVLRTSGTLVLLSQRVGAWREQVGLPIVEGLAHGCEVVTTSETGLATWLSAHGHVVVNPDLSMDRLALVVSRRGMPRGRDDVLADLPDADQRIAADYWLMSAASGPAVDRESWVSR